MNSNTDMELQELISEAILNQLPSVVLPETAQRGDVQLAIRVFMRNHPEIFWFSHQYEFDEARRELRLRYNFSSQKRVFIRKEIDNAVNYLFQPERLRSFSELNKVIYVYKWIASNTTYNLFSSFNQTIYSVLINRNSVCTGYAKTAQYLLGLLGIESRLIFGKFICDRSKSGRHSWNIVKIDGSWYHVDFCLADPTLTEFLSPNEKPIISDGIMWNYFCRSTARILQNRSIEDRYDYPSCSENIDKICQVDLVKPIKQAIVCKSDSGSCSKIFLDSYDKNCAVKIAKTDQTLIDNEKRILNSLQNCDHIVQFKGLCENGIKLELLIPWSELLNSHYYSLDEPQLKQILIQLAEGLIECRSRGITYYDIHYNNVLVTKDGIFRWADFGIAYETTKDTTLPGQVIGNDGIALGSRWFMSRETYYNRIFTESSAVYSLAMLAYFVMNDMRPPFLSSSTTEKEALCKVLSMTSVDLPNKSSLFPSLSKIICDILNSSSSSRIRTFEEFIMSIKTEDIVGVSSQVDQERTNEGDEFVAVDYCSDSFAQTMGGVNGLDLLDADLFAATVAPSASRDIRQDIMVDNITDDIMDDYESDYFASTCWPMSDEEVLSSSKQFGSDRSHDDGKKVGDSWGPAPAQTNSHIINACVYAPEEVRCKKSFIIRVYMYMPNEQEVVDSKVKEIDPSAVKKEYKPLDLPVKDGDKLTVQLDLSGGVECKSTVKSITWRNHFADCSFMAKLVDPSQDSIDVVAYVFVNDVPAGEMLFTIDVVESEPRGLYTKVESRQFSKIFISYAHQDEFQVRGFAECCRMLGTDYFFDRHTLKPGDVFRDKIFNYINNADLFVLCWSKNAAQSEWVKIEREYALQKVRSVGCSLLIYPLCLQPTAPLPSDMSDTYNFGTL